jgi:hypothetical protein
LNSILIVQTVIIVANMNLRAGILGIVAVAALAAPGWAQEARPLPVGGASGHPELTQPLAARMQSVLMAQKSADAPPTVQNAPRRRWEYYTASFYYKEGKAGFFGIGSKKSEWIFELNDKKTSLSEGLAELGSLGYELVGIDPSTSTGHNNTLYIFKRLVEAP